jgi:hypothetical protein
VADGEARWLPDVDGAPLRLRVVQENGSVCWVLQRTMVWILIVDAGDGAIVGLRNDVDAEAR